uniref:Uncharacterized protein n=1 Tax=Trichogramma kaykai TaxID=54128 RepID=A0ABD2WFK4_9HYME
MAVSTSTNGKQNLNEDLTEETVEEKEDSKEESESNPVAKNDKPPPIFMNGVQNVNPLKIKLNEIAGDDFYIKILSNNSVKIDHAGFFFLRLPIARQHYLQARNFQANDLAQIVDEGSKCGEDVTLLGNIACMYSMNVVTFLRLAWRHRSTSNSSSNYRVSLRCMFLISLMSTSYVLSSLFRRLMRFSVTTFCSSSCTQSLSGCLTKLCWFSYFCRSFSPTALVS